MDDLKLSETLLDNLRQSLCIPWCGAGLSKACDLPLWGELVKKLITYSFASDFTTKRLSGNKAWQNSRFVRQLAHIPSAEECASMLKKDQSRKKYLSDLTD